MLDTKLTASFFTNLKNWYLLTDETCFCHSWNEFREVWNSQDRGTIIHLAWMFIATQDTNFKVATHRLFVDAWTTAEDERAFRLQFIDFCINFFTETKNDWA